MDSYAYDPDKAKQLLADAGWDKLNGDKPITVLTYYNNQLATNVLAAVQAMLAQVGINVVPRAVDTPDLQRHDHGPEARSHAVPARLCRPAQRAGPGGLNLGLNEKQIPPKGANFLRIRMPEVSACPRWRAQRSPTTPSGSRRYQAVCQAMNKNLPWATMWVANRYGVASTKLKDFVWTPAPGGGPYAAHPEKWAQE